jgi:hypothetical protein
MNWFVHSRPKRWYTSAYRFALSGEMCTAFVSESQKSDALAPVVPLAHRRLDEFNKVCARERVLDGNEDGGENEDEVEVETDETDKGEEKEEGRKRDTLSMCQTSTVRSHARPAVLGTCLRCTARR